VAASYRSRSPSTILTIEEPTMPTPDTTPGAPNWIQLFTSDPDTTVAFYNDLFGWTCEIAEEFGGYLNFAKDGKRVAGGIKNDGTAGVQDGWWVYLATTDARATGEAAAAAGGTVIAPAAEVADLGSMVVVTDPGGASVGGWQPGTHSGFEIRGETGFPAWFELHTRDYAKAVAFYEKVFKWDARTMSDTDDFKYTTLGEGDDALAGIMDSAGFLPEGVPSQWAVYFQTDDADKTVARIKELGGSVVEEPHDTPYGRLAIATDPAGGEFRLLQPPAA
jgi:hypothetical protein